MSGRWRASALFLLLFLVPFGVRAIVHLELSDDPFYAHLFVDARIYHEIARILAEGSQAMSGPHWQPPFYPRFLSWIYGLWGPTPEAARWVQIVLGSFTAVLVWILAARVVSTRVGWVAWAILALAGPCVYFDLQLLPASLATFLLVAVLLGLLVGLPRDSSFDGRTALVAGCAGVGGGLGALTVGNLLLLLPWGVAWIVLGRPRTSLPTRGTVRRLEGFRRAPGAHLRSARHALALGAVFGAAFLAPLITNTIENHRVSGELIPISYNGGINFWIGNNPDYAATVAIRPGREWQALTAEPLRAGVTGFRAQSDYFVRKSLDWAGSSPGAALSLVFHKLRLFLRGDEIPRNQEIYPFRASSHLLATLLWIQGLAFPTGLVLPLAGAGAVLAVAGSWSGPGGSVGPGRRIPRAGSGRSGPTSADSRPDRAALSWLACFVVLYALSVVAFFATARYRVPLYPALAIFAAVGVERILRARLAGRGPGRVRTGDDDGSVVRPGRSDSRIDSSRGDHHAEDGGEGPPRAASTSWRTILALLVGLGLFAMANLGLPAMTSLPGSDTLYDLGLAYQEAGNRTRAQQLYEEALVADPGNAEAHNNLAGLLLEVGRPAAARPHLEAVVGAYPEDVSARLNLVRVLLAEGEIGVAGEQLAPLAARLPEDERVRKLWGELERLRSTQDARTVRGPGGP